MSTLSSLVAPLYQRLLSCPPAVQTIMTKWKQSSWCQLYHHWWYWRLFYDKNMWCHQWWQNWHHNNLCFQRIRPKIECCPITTWFSLNWSQQADHSSSARLSYGVSFENSKRDRSSTLNITTVLYTICNLWLYESWWDALVSTKSAQFKMEIIFSVLKGTEGISTSSVPTTQLHHWNLNNRFFSHTGD